MTIDYLEKITLQDELKNVKEQLKTIQDENTELKTTIATLTAAIYKLSEENRNRIKDHEAEIDQLKSNAPTVSYSELMCIHTADVETIDKLNIKVRDLNSTISTLLERVSTYDKENQELTEKVQELNDFIQRI